MAFQNIDRLGIKPILTAVTGIGVSANYFCKDPVPLRQGESASFIFGLYNVVGTFSAITINLEFSPALGAQAYWEIVATWSPLSQPMLVTPCSEAGFYRLNVTAFTGGTQFDVWVTIGNGVAPLTTLIPSANVSIIGPIGPQSEANSVSVTFAANQPSALFTGTTNAAAALYGVGVGGQFLTVLPTLTNTQESVLMLDANGRLLVNSSSSNTYTLAGSPPVEALNVNVVNPTSVTFPGSIAVTQSTSPWVVSGTVGIGAGSAVIGHVITDTGSTTAVSGGTLIVTQSNGANLHVDVDSAASTAVTNVGTFLVQADQAGSWTVNAQPAGLFPVQISTALPAGTNVIGHVISDTGSTTAVTGTVAVTQSTSPWVISFTAPQHVIVDSATLGTVTVSGTVAVTQSTSPWVISFTAPQHVIIDSSAAISVTQGTSPWVVSGTVAFSNSTIAVTNAGTFATQATQAGTWNIGTVTAVTAITNALPAGTNVIGHVITDTGSTTAITGTVNVNIEGTKATYSCFATFVAAAGDIAVLPGSASKTIRITRVEVSLSTSGTAAIEAVQLVKRSTADSGGTSLAMPTAPHDSADAAATALPLSYTVAPTLGTVVSAIRGVQFADSSSAALPGANSWLWTWGDRGGAKEIVLRGVAQMLCVNLGGAVATQTANVSYEWTEE